MNIFYIKKNDNKNKPPIINLNDATDTGLIVDTEIFIAINADPQ